MQLQLYNSGRLSQKQTVSECLDLNLHYRDVGYSQKALQSLGCSTKCEVHWQVRCSESLVRNLKISALSSFGLYPPLLHIPTVKWDNGISSTQGY